MIIEENIALAPFTTLGVGGTATYFVQANTEEEVVDALEFADKRGVEVFVLGGGSNLLISDNGWEGLVLHVAIDREITEPIAYREDKETLYLTAAAGTEWDAFVEYSVEHGSAGLANMSGIPGLVGGAPIQNIGAYGQEASQAILSVTCIDRTTGEKAEIAAADCGFSYRESIFNTAARDRYIITAVTFALCRDERPNLEYRDLRQHFGTRVPDLRQLREAVIAIRRTKSMVIDPDDPNRRSAGSFFKNPVVSQEVFGSLKCKYDSIPSFPFGDRVKVPAAWLIENAGLHKGFRMGNAGISSNHTLAIINCGGSTAAEIIALKDLVQERVLERFGLELTPEPVLVGF